MTYILVLPQYTGILDMQLPTHKQKTINWHKEEPIIPIVPEVFFLWHIAYRLKYISILWDHISNYCYILVLSPTRPDKQNKIDIIGCTIGNRTKIYNSENMVDK